MMRPYREIMATRVARRGYTARDLGRKCGWYGQNGDDQHRDDLDQTFHRNLQPSFVRPSHGGSDYDHRAIHAQINCQNGVMAALAFVLQPRRDAGPVVGAGLGSRIARFAVGALPRIALGLRSSGAMEAWPRGSLLKRAHQAMALAVRPSVAHGAMHPCRAPSRIQSGGRFATMQRLRGAGRIRHGRRQERQSDDLARGSLFRRLVLGTIAPVRRGFL